MEALNSQTNQANQVLVVDTRAGNLFSLKASIERLGYEVVITPEAPEINSEVDKSFAALVIPGQGRFGTVMSNLIAGGWPDFLDAFRQSKRPILGICVGMQIMFEGSEEDPGIPGLGWYKGTIEKLEFSKQPMVGWATLESSFYPDWPVYFVNSFALRNSSLSIANSSYGETFVAAIKNEAVTGVQFHPEKSADQGAKIIADALTNQSESQQSLVTETIKLNQNTNRLLPRVIVCLDVDKGRVVKGTNFKDLKDMGDPIELALKYQEQGADELVFLDISATRERRPTALKLVTEIARHLSIPFTVGGGLKTLDDVKAFLDAGADKVALNSTAVTNPDIINATAKAYGSQCVVVAIDVDSSASGLTCYINGGHKSVDLDFYQWTDEVSARGAGEILLTAMHKDGTGTGFDNNLTSEVSARLPIQVIASGGAKTPEHFPEAFNAGADAALAAGMFHSAAYSIDDVKNSINQAGIKSRQQFNFTNTSGVSYSS